MAGEATRPVASVGERNGEGAELEDLRCNAQRWRPYGSEDWVVRMAGRLGFESALHATQTIVKDPFSVPVSHTVRYPRIRIISARRMSRRERKIYEEG